MKSALMAQLAMCVANFKDWNGLRHKNYGGVLYFALERHDLVKRRLWAHHATMAMDDGCGVAVASGMVDLSTAAGVDRVVATVEEASKELSNVGLVIFDTFAKLVSAAGLDENKAERSGANICQPAAGEGQAQSREDRFTPYRHCRPYRQGRNPRRQRIQRLLRRR